LFDAVRDIDLARPGQFGVFLRLFPIALCRLRSGLNSSNPLYLPQLTFSSELGHRDEGDGAKTGLNGARMRACYRRNSALKDIPTARCCCRARSAALRQCPRGTCGVQHNRILHRPTRARRQSRMVRVFRQRPLARQPGHAKRDSPQRKCPYSWSPRTVRHSLLLRGF
jgi:hypothetical protein